MRPPLPREIADDRHCLAATAPRRPRLGRGCAEAMGSARARTRSWVPDPEPMTSGSLERNPLPRAASARACARCEGATARGGSALDHRGGAQGGELAPAADGVVATRAHQRPGPLVGAAGAL